MRIESLAPPRAIRIWLAVLATSTLLCVLGYLILAVPGSWFGAKALRWGAQDLSATRGTLKPGPGGLAMLAPDAAGTALVTINVNLRSTDYPMIAWDAIDVPATASAMLLWRNDYDPGRLFMHALTVESGHLAPAFVGRDPNWIGKIGGLALSLRGELPQPVVIRGVTAKPMTAGEMLRDRASEWFHFEPWNGASINVVVGGADAQELPLPVLLAIIVGVAAVGYAALARWCSRWVGPLRPVIVGGFFLAAWLLLDARWQWNLLRQVALTGHQYAGKSWQERHLAAEDGPLFAFIEKVRGKLPPPPARVFMAADLTYFRDRGAYHLYPYNVYFDPRTNTIPPPSAMRTGDYFVVFQRKGVQYDAANQKLRWDGKEAIGAEFLLGDAGAALFRIR